MNTFGDEVDDDDADDLESSPLPFPPLPLSIIILAAIEPDPPEVSLLPLSAPPPDDGVRNVEVVSMLLDDGGGFTIVEQRTKEAPADFGVCNRFEDVLMVLVGVGVHDVRLEAVFSSRATLISSFPSPVELGDVMDSSWSIALAPLLLKKKEERSVPSHRCRLHLLPPVDRVGRVELARREVVKYVHK